MEQPGSGAGGRLTIVPIGDLSLNEAVHDVASAEHRAMTGLPGNQEEQTAVRRVGVGGAEEVGADERLLSL